MGLQMRMMGEKPPAPPTFSQGKQEPTGQSLESLQEDPSEATPAMGILPVNSQDNATVHAMEEEEFCSHD